MDKTSALQNLFNGTASQEEINLLRQMLTNGEISIGGNVNRSVLIIGSGNTFELPPKLLERLNARPLLGNLERELMGEEIALGLRRLERLLPRRAPVLQSQFNEQTIRLRPYLKTNLETLSEQSRKERVEALAIINGICLEVVDISFNGLCLGESVPKYDARSPFRGLEAFRPEDSQFFFGREELTQKLVWKIKAHSFLAVLGASGSGKSSLVMAGLIPTVRLGYNIFRPGHDPLGALESAKGKDLLVVDQFEELFTLVRDESIKKEFIANLLKLTKDCKIIITLRSDFLGEVAVYRDLNGEVQEHLENVPPMNIDELHRAMLRQASIVGLRFEADLSQQILDDVKGEPGAMPLLQHALWELWNRRHGRWLRVSRYRAYGGVKQAISSTAEKIYAECTKSEQEQIRDIFIRLTRLDDEDDGRDTRRRVRLEEFLVADTDTDSMKILLDKLAHARLIIKTLKEGNAEIEVAHEALIRHWDRLRGWLNEDRDELRLRQGVNDAAREWETSGRDANLLLHHGGRLEDALKLRRILNIQEQEYLTACKNATLRRRRIIISSILFIAFVILTILIGWAWTSNENAVQLRHQVATSVAAQATAVQNEYLANMAKAESQKQAEIALARQLAAQAQSIIVNRNSKQMTAVLLAVQSMKIIPSSESAQVLINNNNSVQPLSCIQHSFFVNSVTFSSDGRYIISGSGDRAGTVRVWDSLTGTDIVIITHDSPVHSVAFSPDGKYAVSGGGIPGSNIGTARVWDIASGAEVSRMTHDATVYSVAISPNGKYVVSGGIDRTARIWGLSTGTEIARMTHGNYVKSVAFSLDGAYVISGSADGTARVWEALNGKEISRVTHESRVLVVAFSPDGKHAASGGQDNTARIWEFTSGIEIASMVHDATVNSIAFSPDGEYVVSGSDDNTARTWEALNGQEISRMTHDDGVISVAFSPTGRLVASSGWDETARIWDVFTGKELTRMTHNGSVVAVAFSPDGKYVASGSDDYTACVWKSSTNRDHFYLNHFAKVYSVDFSPDGNFIVSGSNDKILRVWDVSTGSEVAHMLHDASIVTVAFNPDGRYVVSGSLDDTIRVWDLSTSSEVARYKHDDVLSSVTFSPDGKFIVSGSFDKTARIWEVSTGIEITRMPHTEEVYTVSFSPDGKFLATGSAYSDQNKVRIWEVSTGTEIISMTHDDEIFSVAFSPDGKYIVSGSYDKTIRVWDIFTRREISRMTHDDIVLAVAFSPDGNFVVSGSADNTARVWEVSTGKEVARALHDDYVNSVDFSPDGKYIVSGSNDETVRIWQWQAKELISNACLYISRNLSRAEWLHYIGDALPYQPVCPNLPIELNP